MTNTAPTEAAFWERWYRLTGHYEVGPAATRLHMKEDTAQTQHIYQTFKKASDAELEAWRGRYPLPNPATSRVCVVL